MADCKIVYYNSTSSSIQLGDFLYQNQAQTIPATAGYYAWTVDDKWFRTDAEGVVIESGSCGIIPNFRIEGLVGSVLMGCVTQSASNPNEILYRWNDSYFTSSQYVMNTRTAGTGSNPYYGYIGTPLRYTTASFQAYDFTKPFVRSGDRGINTDEPVITSITWCGNAQATASVVSNSFDFGNQLTAQIWGCIPTFTDSSSFAVVPSGSSPVNYTASIGKANILFTQVNNARDETWVVFQSYTSSQNNLHVEYRSGSGGGIVSQSVSMSLSGGNYPLDRLTMYTMRFSGSDFRFYSGSTRLGTITLPAPYTNIPTLGAANDLTIFTGAQPVGNVGQTLFKGEQPMNTFFLNSALLYDLALDEGYIDQNNNAYINGFTASINLEGCIEPTPNFPTTDGLAHSLPYGGISQLVYTCIASEFNCGNPGSGIPPGTLTYYPRNETWFDGYQPSIWPGNSFVTCSFIDFPIGNSPLDVYCPWYTGSFGISGSGGIGTMFGTNFRAENQGNPNTIQSNLPETPFLSTASFEAYDFSRTWRGNTGQYPTESNTFRSGSGQWRVAENSILSDGPYTAIMNPINTSNGFTYQIWGALNTQTTENCGIFSLIDTSRPEERYSIFTKTSSSLDTNKQIVFAKISGSSAIPLPNSQKYAVSMSITGGNWPLDRLSLFTFMVSSSTFSVYSGSTLLGSRQLPEPFITQVPAPIPPDTSAADSISFPLYNPLQLGTQISSSTFNYTSGWTGFVNHQLIYNKPLTVNQIQQNLNGFLTNTTSSIDKNNVYKPPFVTPTTTTTSTTTTTTTTTSTTTTTTSTSTTTTLGPEIITRGLSSYLNFRNFFSASLENNDLWYDSVQLVSESACSRVIGIDSADEGCGENRPDCPVFLSTGSFNAWDWPNVFNCNKSVFFQTGAFASSSNQTYVFYGAWDKDSNYGFVRNRNFQTSLQRANKIYSQNSNIVLETYWNNGTTHTLELPITASTFTSSSLSMLTVRVENGNTASVFENGNLILTKETSSLNFQSQNAGYTYWLDSDDVSDYTMFAHSMLIYTASLTNNEISRLSTAINNNITGSY